jgi:hypothetical protein
MGTNYEIVCGEEKIFFTGLVPEQPRQDKYLMYQHDRPKDSTK